MAFSLTHVKSFQLCTNSTYMSVYNLLKFHPFVNICGFDQNSRHFMTAYVASLKTTGDVHWFSVLRGFNYRAATALMTRDWKVGYGDKEEN